MDPGSIHPDVIRIVAMRQRRPARLDLEIENPHPGILVGGVMMGLARRGHGLLSQRKASAGQRCQCEIHEHESHAPW